jgi:hypothetical protein
MSEQQSQKRGVPSDAQKTQRAREGYDPIPPSNPVAGAFGQRERDTPTDEDLALQLNAKDARERKEEQ